MKRYTITFIATSLFVAVAIGGLQMGYAQEAASLNKLLSSDSVLNQYKQSLNKNVRLVGQDFDTLSDNDRKLLIRRINFNMALMENVAFHCGFEWDNQGERDVDITVSLVPTVDISAKHLLSKLSDIYQLDTHEKLQLQGRIPSLRARLAEQGFVRLLFGLEPVHFRNLENMAIIWDWSMLTEANKVSAVDFMLFSGLFGLPVDRPSPQEMSFSLFFHTGSISELADSSNEHSNRLCNAANLIKVICGGAIEPEYELRTTQVLSKLNAECSNPSIPHFFDEVAKTFDENE